MVALDAVGRRPLDYLPRHQFQAWEAAALRGGEGSNIGGDGEQVKSTRSQAYAVYVFMNLDF
jgi:hypothetical protein